MTKADEKFDQIVHEEVLPAISKAFCSLYQALQGKNSEPLKIKSDQVKRDILKYVDGQLASFNKMMDKREPTPECQKSLDNIREYYGKGSNVILNHVCISKGYAKSCGGLAEMFEKNKSQLIDGLYEDASEVGLSKGKIAGAEVAPRWELMEKDTSNYYLPVEFKMSFFD